MRLIAFTAALLLLTGCYTKHRAIEKFCHMDSSSAVITVRDTVIIPAVKADTAFIAGKADTVTLIKDNLFIRYIKFHDTIFLSGHYTGDTVYRIKTITVNVPCN